MSEKTSLYCGGLVVVGLLIEVFLAILHLPYECFWERWGSVFADILVASGVLGEVLFSARANTCQSELVRRSNSKLEDAHTLAILADSRSASASSAAETARRELGKSNERAAALEKEAAEAKLELVNLQKRLAPRITGAELSDALTGRPTAHVRIEYLKDAPDTFELVGWVVSRLVPAGWMVDDVSPIRGATDGVLSTLPIILSAGGQLTGVTIVPSVDVPGIAGGSDGQVSIFHSFIEADKRIKE